MKKLIFRNFAKDTLNFFIIMCLSVGVIVWTLQAVNYFDFVSQDGHGLKTYFSYIILNFPKIIHRIIPFIFFITLFYIINEYEYKNELQIFWTFGITKIDFANNFDNDLKEENKEQMRDFSNDFEITKIVTSEEDQLLHSKRLEEIEKKTGKKTLWNS